MNKEFEELELELMRGINKLTINLLQTSKISVEDKMRIVILSFVKIIFSIISYHTIAFSEKKAFIKLMKKTNDFISLVSKRTKNDIINGYESLNNVFKKE